MHDSILSQCKTPTITTRNTVLKEETIISMPWNSAMEYWDFHIEKKQPKGENHKKASTSTWVECARRSTLFCFYFSLCMFCFTSRVLSHCTYDDDDDDDMYVLHEIRRMLTHKMANVYRQQQQSRQLLWQAEHFEYMNMHILGAYAVCVKMRMENEQQERNANNKTII